MSEKKKALITGVSGQDGSYLAELLLQKGYEVHGLVRSETLDDPRVNSANLKLIQDRIQIHTGGFDNVISLYKTIEQVQPDECYHLAASSFVSYSFDDEFSILNNNFHGTHCLLAALKERSPSCRFYFAGSSEMFGDALESPQHERTHFNPRSIYGIAKLSSYHLSRNYRDKYGMFICAGILYNHESPRRGFEFVTRKITSTVARIKLGQARRLTLGNLDARRDWGYAPDYVQAMWQMLQQPNPEDFVIATGQTHTVRQFVESAFQHVGLDYKQYVDFDAKYFRASENLPLVGDSSKARSVLGWKNTKPVGEIISEMINSDLALFSK